MCVRKARNPASPKTHHEIHSSPATATTSGRRATKHVPRVNPYSHASIEPGFVEIGFVQLSQSVKTTNVTHALTDTHRQTDRLMKSGTLHAPRYEEAFLPIGRKRQKTASVASLPRPCLIMKGRSCPIAKKRPHCEETFLPSRQITASLLVER